MIFFNFFLFVICILDYSLAIIDNYAGKCVINQLEGGIPFSCSVAAFSTTADFILENISIEFINTKLCKDDSHIASSSSTTTSTLSNNVIGIVQRGKCSFEEKVLQAQLMNSYSALIIVNNEDNVFPPSASEGFKSIMPILMVSSSFYNNLIF